MAFDRLEFSFWFQNNDTEVSTASVYVGAAHSGDVPSTNVALNRVSWTQSGLHVTVGDDMGKIWVSDMAPRQCFSTWVPREPLGFAHTLLRSVRILKLAHFEYLGSSKCSLMFQRFLG